MIFSAIAFALFSGAFVFQFHQILVPDTHEYARGTACWSSLVSCTVGMADGWTGLKLVGVIGATFLGLVFGYYGSFRRRQTLRGFAILGPPTGWETYQASPDALGGAMVLLTLRSQHAGRTLALLCLTLCCHLEAGLCAATVVAARRLGFRHDGAACFLAGLGACVGEFHPQLRYVFPGFVTWIT